MFLDRLATHSWLAVVLGLSILLVEVLFRSGLPCLQRVLLIEAGWGGFSFATSNLLAAGSSDRGWCGFSFATSNLLAAGSSDRGWGGFSFATSNLLGAGSSDLCWGVFSFSTSTIFPIAVGGLDAGGGISGDGVLGACGGISGEGVRWSSDAISNLVVLENFADVVGLGRETVPVDSLTLFCLPAASRVGGLPRRRFSGVATFGTGDSFVPVDEWTFFCLPAASRVGGLPRRRFSGTASADSRVGGLPARPRFSGFLLFVCFFREPADTV